MVGPMIGDTSLLLRVLGAVSTVKFRPPEPRPLTVSSARHLEEPEEPHCNGDSDEVIDDETCSPTETRLWVVIRESSIELWDLSTSSGL